MNAEKIFSIPIAIFTATKSMQINKTQLMFINDDYGD